MRKKEQRNRKKQQKTRGKVQAFISLSFSQSTLSLSLSRTCLHEFDRVAECSGGSTPFTVCALNREREKKGTKHGMQYKTETERENGSTIKEQGTGEQVKEMDDPIGVVGINESSVPRAVRHLVPLQPRHE